jgi:hypothetical protein
MFAVAVFINDLGLAATKVLLGRWTHKQTEAHPHNGIVLSDQKEMSCEPWKDMEEP